MHVASFFLLLAINLTDFLVNSVIYSVILQCKKCRNGRKKKEVEVETPPEEEKAAVALDLSQEPDATFDEIDGREQINLPSLDNGPHFAINKRNTFVELKVKEEPAPALLDALHYVKGAGGNYQLQRKVAPVS